MKKFFIIFMFVCLLLTMTSCSSAPIDTDVDTNQENTAANEENNEEEVPIDPDDILPEITILKPDSIGTVYMEATYTNNSEYPITSYELTVLLKDKNETTYLSTYDTVMPGETSPKFESFGPETQDPNDYEILALSVTARTEEGQDIYIDYDFKLNEASWF